MQNHKNQPKFFKTLFADFKRLFSQIFDGSFLVYMKKDYRDLQRFFLEEERRERLERMNRIRRFFYVIFWLIQALFFRLASVRRALLFIGIILILTARNTQNSDNTVLLAGMIFLFILLLELKDKITARTELEAGRSVQKALAPAQDPEVPGWEIWLFTRSANDVGGDLVDFIDIESKRYAVVVGDVAGKGLAAALFMAKLQAVLRAIAPDFESPSKLCEKLNHIFHRDSLPNSFASLVYLEIKPDQGDIAIINAGHMPPLFIRKNNIEEFKKGEPALGLMPETNYNEIALKLQKGDKLIIYSDGITEACNEDEQFYGESRFMNLIESNRHLPAKSLGKVIVRDVENFIGTAPTTDDLSLAILIKK